AAARRSGGPARRSAWSTPDPTRSTARVRPAPRRRGTGARCPRSAGRASPARSASPLPRRSTRSTSLDLPRAAGDLDLAAAHHAHQVGLAPRRADLVGRLAGRLAREPAPQLAALAVDPLDQAADLRHVDRPGARIDGQDQRAVERLADAALDQQGVAAHGVVAVVVLVAGLEPLAAHARGPELR